MSEAAFAEAISLDEGTSRVAALAAWVQSAAQTVESTPVLVGGGAVELYSGGAYRTGDLDFVGSVGKQLAQQLEEAGFRKLGRHWVHEEHEIFLEFPGAELGEGETVALIEVGKYSVLIIGLEELMIDRLAAWQFWSSEVDGINAFRLARVSPDELDWERALELARAREVREAFDALRAFLAGRGETEPTTEELEEWAREALKGIR